MVDKLEEEVAVGKDAQSCGLISLSLSFGSKQGTYCTVYQTQKHAKHHL